MKQEIFVEMPPTTYPRDRRHVWVPKISEINDYNVISVIGFLEQMDLSPSSHQGFGNGLVHLLKFKFRKFLTKHHIILCKTIQVL
jgi:hypothetical protein